MMKKCGRSLVSLLLVFILVVSVFTISGSAASVFSGSKYLTFGSQRIEFKNATITTSKYGTLYINDPDDDEKSVDISIKTLAKNYQEMKFEVYPPSGYIMYFDYEIEQTANMGNHYFKFAPPGATEDVTYDLYDGITYMLVGSSSAGSSTPNRCLFTIRVNGNQQQFTAHMKNVRLIKAEKVDVTVKAPQHGSVVVNNTTTVSNSDLTLSDDNGVRTDTGVILDATPADGYTFAGYKINGSSELIAPSSGTNYTFFPTASGDTVEAVFVSKSEPHFLVGNMNNRKFKLVDTMTEALAVQNAHYIIPITNATITQDCTIPAGTTLVIPNNNNRTVYTTEPAVVTSRTNPYSFVKLTVAPGVTVDVEGELSVGGSAYSPSGGQSAAVSGAYGQLAISDGAVVNVKDGAKLYAWGFVTSVGETTAESDPLVVIEPGAEVFEMFQITDYTGGSIIKDVLDLNVFPFSQYYVQNVECKMCIVAGAHETVFGCLTAGGTPTGVSLTFIGDEGSLFALNEGCAIKYYDVQQDKLICRLDAYDGTPADAAINPIALSLAGMVNMDTTNYQLPISNIGVEIGEGTVTIAQDLQLFPDSYVTVEEDGELEIESNIYITDKETIQGHMYPGNATCCRPLVYSATRYETTGSGASSRKSDGSVMSEPYVVNNGTVTINSVNRGTDEEPNYVGSINTVGEGGTMTGTGSVVNNAVEDVTASDLRLLSFTTVEYEENGVIKHRTGGTITDEEPVTECADVEAFDDDGNALAYRYDADRQVWHTDQVVLHFIDSEDPDYVDDRTVAYGSEVTFPTLTMEGYSLSWYNEANTEETHTPGSAMTAYDYATYVTDWAELPVIGDLDDPIHSLSLEGSIHVNFYWPIEGSSDGYTYTFSFMGQTTDPLPLPTAPDSNGYGYKTGIEVDAPEMTEDIVATLYYGGAEVLSNTFRAVDYAVAYNDLYKATDDALQNNTPYLMGTINGSTNWTQADPRFKFTENPNNADEYMLANVALTAGDSFKVVKYYSETQSYGYYPDGTDNNYTVTQNGVYNIYFKKNPDGFVDGWHYGKFYVETVSTDNGVYQATLLPTLLQATVNYGAKAQSFFNVDANDLADDYISYKGNFGVVSDDMIASIMGEAPDIDDNIFAAYGLEYLGTSLVMNSSTKLKMYFGVSNASLFNACKDSFTMNGEAVTPVYVSSNMVTFTVDNIAPANLNQRCVLKNTADDELSVAFAPLDYAALTLGQKTSNPGLYQLGQALYWYYIYAHAYFN